MKFVAWFLVSLPLWGQVSHRRYTTDPVRSPIQPPTASAPIDPDQLTVAEVKILVNTAAMADNNPAEAIAVVDRGGHPLAIYRRPQAANDSVELALSLARTGAFFSNQNTPLSSRTVRAISRPNFPEEVPNTPSGALYGIENTNRGCPLNTTFHPGQGITPARNAANNGPGAGIANVPGGLPLFRNGFTVVGGIGVAGYPDTEYDVAEYAAFLGSLYSGFAVHLPLPDPGGVILDGFLLPFIALQPPALHAASQAAAMDGSFDVQPIAGLAVPEGWLVGPMTGSALSSSDVQGIVQNAINTANLTRAAIRLPITHAEMMIAVVDLDGAILGLYRMPDSTIFSIDVAVAKARNVVYFSGPNLDPQDLPGVPIGTAVTNRTVGFGGQPFFPSGIENSQPGPFYPLYQFDWLNPCTQGHQPKNPNQSGIVFFPGSAPLYRNGAMVGGLGVSGDGVEQDDFVTAGGAQGFDAPLNIRADQIFIRDVRLPYWKFPRNPEIQ